MMNSPIGKTSEVQSQLSILLVLLFVPGILLHFIFPLQFPMIYWDEGLWSLGPKHAVTIGDPFAYGWSHCFLSPLHYFITTKLYQILEPSLIYSRWLSGVFSLGTIVFTYLLASRLYSCRTGFIAAILVTYNSMMIIAARQAMLESEVTFCMLGAAYFWFTRKKTLVPISAFFIAASLLVKVTSLVLIPALLLGQLFLREQNLQQTRAWWQRITLYQWAAIVAGIGIAVICLFSISRINPELFRATWLGHTVQREEMILFGRQPTDLLSIRSIFRFVYDFIIHMPLSIAFAIVGIIFSLKYSKTGVYFLLFWMLITFLMVSSQWYRPTRYYFPIIPALAVLASSGIEQIFHTRESENRRRMALLLVLLMSVFQTLRLTPYWIDGASINRAYRDAANWLKANSDESEPIIAINQIALLVKNPIIPAPVYIDERWRASIDPGNEIRLPDASYMVTVYSRRNGSRFKHWANEYLSENYVPVKYFNHYITIFRLKETL